MGRVVVILLILLAVASNPAFAQPMTVIAVYDGDTFAVDRQGAAVKVKLYGIDAPESGQHGNVSSTRFLRRMILGSMVELREVEVDGYGLPQAIVVREGRESSVNAAIVAQGYAWVNPNTCRIDACDHWQVLQSQAKTNQLGIWSGFDRVPPWEFRQSQSR